MCICVLISVPLGLRIRCSQVAWGLFLVCHLRLSLVLSGLLFTSLHPPSALLITSGSLWARVLAWQIGALQGSLLSQSVCLPVLSC